MSMTKVCDFCGKGLDNKSFDYVGLDIRPQKGSGKLVDICFTCWSNPQQTKQLVELINPKEGQL